MEIHIGAKIRQKLSKMPNLTVKAFAEKLGVHEQTVYDIYKRPDVNTDLLRKISEILDVPLSYFFEPGETVPVKETSTSVKNSRNTASDYNGNGTSSSPYPKDMSLYADLLNDDRYDEEETVPVSTPIYADTFSERQPTAPLNSEPDWRTLFEREKEKNQYLERILNDKEYIVRLLEARMRDHKLS